MATVASPGLPAAQPARPRLSDLVARGTPGQLPPRGLSACRLVGNATQNPHPSRRGCSAVNGQLRDLNTCDTAQCRPGVPAPGWIFFIYFFHATHQRLLDFFSRARVRPSSHQLWPSRPPRGCGGRRVSAVSYRARDCTRQAQGAAVQSIDSQATQPVTFKGELYIIIYIPLRRKPGRIADKPRKAEGEEAN